MFDDLSASVVEGGERGRGVALGHRLDRLAGVDAAVLELAEPDVADSVPEPVIASPVPDMPVADEAMVKGDQELTLVLGDRHYRVRGWKSRSTPRRSR